MIIIIKILNSILTNTKHKTMNQRQLKEMYPAISYNSKQRCEERWEDDAKIYGDIDASWNIAIGNGKRMRRQWIKAGGLLFTEDSRGREHTVYNDKYDVEWQKALYDKSFQPDVEARVYTGGYDSIPYHVGMDEDDEY